MFTVIEQGRTREYRMYGDAVISRGGGDVWNPSSAVRAGKEIYDVVKVIHTVRQVKDYLERCNVVVDKVGGTVTITRK